LYFFLFFKNKKDARELIDFLNKKEVYKSNWSNNGHSTFQKHEKNFFIIKENLSRLTTLFLNDFSIS